MSRKGYIFFPATYFLLTKADDLLYDKHNKYT